MRFLPLLCQYPDGPTITPAPTSCRSRSQFSCFRPLTVLGPLAAGKVDAIEEFGEEEYEQDGDDWGGDVLVVYCPASLPIPESSAFTAVPCGVCPVFGECTQGGLVSPQTCEYMAEWLAF